MYEKDKAVIKSFIPSYKIWLWLFPVVFGAIAAGFLLLIIVSHIMTEKDNLTKRIGTPIIGTYLDKKKLINIDNFDLYSIICTFKNDDGGIIEVKTRFLYDNSEAEYFAKMGSFPIIYRGIKAIILTNEENNE